MLLATLANRTATTNWWMPVTMGYPWPGFARYGWLWLPVIGAGRFSFGAMALL